MAVLSNRAKKQPQYFVRGECQHQSMTSITPLSLSMLGADRWLATRGNEPVGRIELENDRFVVNTADSHRVGRYRDFSKALAALDGYRGLGSSWKVLLPITVLFGALAVSLAVFGVELLF